MAKIEAFASIHYNPEVIQDMSRVVCPPYDVIDPRAQEELYQKHPYNFIRLILGKDVASDSETENKYTRVAGYFEEWVRRGIFVQDNEPAIYLYEQEFKVAGQVKRRFGFMALMGLGDEGESANIYPHEHTHVAPKQDRLRVIKAVEANLSPIFTIYSDPKKTTVAFFREAVKKDAPLFVAVDGDGGTNKLWRVTDKAEIGKIKALLSDKDLFIADGHHRFEVSKMFRDFKKTSDSLHFKDAYNYILTYFTPLEDEGLVVLPTHRLIREASFSMEALSPLFTAKEVPGKDALLIQMQDQADKVGTFGLYMDGKFSLIKIADKVGCNRMIQEGPQAYKNLDVAILHKVIFDRLFNITLPQVSYEVDLDRAVAAVDSKAFDALFILNPTKIDQIREIALGGEVMPQKSTYFYPKLLSGLVIHKF
jgi:uncharacterized protein (DUF1015 family)